MPCQPTKMRLKPIPDIYHVQMPSLLCWRKEEQVKCPKIFNSFRYTNRNILNIIFCVNPLPLCIDNR